jgi:hypothetical protein
MPDKIFDNKFKQILTVKAYISPIKKLLALHKIKKLKEMLGDKQVSNKDILLI